MKCVCAPHKDPKHRKDTRLEIEWYSHPIGILNKIFVPLFLANRFSIKLAVIYSVAAIRPTGAHCLGGRSFVEKGVFNPGV